MDFVLEADRLNLALEALLLILLRRIICSYLVSVGTVTIK